MRMSSNSSWRAPTTCAAGSSRSTIRRVACGYLRWRTDQKKRQSAEVGDILLANGYDADEIVRVGSIVAKRHLATDPVVQTHEDALCLAFLQLQFDALADQSSATIT